MSGILRTPTDMSAPPMIGPTMAPPIIPGLTQIAPGAMRALLRNEMGMEEEEQKSEEAGDSHTPESEQGLLAEFGNLFWKAGEYPGLQEVMLSFAKALKKAADQRNTVSTQTHLRMPVPITALRASSEDTAPHGDLLSMFFNRG